VVVARADAIEHRAGQCGTEGFASLLLDHDLPLESAATQLQLDDGLVDLELIADDVAHGLTIDGTELVAGVESGEIRRGTGRNRLDTGSRHRRILRGAA
jgi:hypothetical protein